MHILDLALCGQSVRASGLQSKCFIETLMKSFYNHNIQLVTYALICSRVKEPSFFSSFGFTPYFIASVRKQEVCSATLCFLSCLCYQEDARYSDYTPQILPFNLEVYFHLQRFTVSLTSMVIIESSF